jgi:hypothetical protein
VRIAVCSQAGKPSAIIGEITIRQPQTRPLADTREVLNGTGAQMAAFHAENFLGMIRRGCMKIVLRYL